MNQEKDKKELVLEEQVEHTKEVNQLALGEDITPKIKTTEQQGKSEAKQKKLTMNKLVVFLAVLLIVVGGVIYYFVSEKIKINPQNTNKAPQQVYKADSQAIIDGKALSNGWCEGEEKPKLNTLPMKYDDFSFIIPYGLSVGGHVTPIDHQYFSPTVFNSPRDTYDVVAMADSTIVDIGPRTTDKGTEYRFVFSLSCKLFYYYDLVTSLAPDVQKVYDESKNGGRPLVLKVKAGQLIGKIGGQTLDFAVWDMDERLKGFVVPEHYDGEGWKIHTVDPLNYYTEELKSQVLTKYIRTAEPISGKIDYDIDGKLVGTWFKEGTVGYIPPGNVGGESYWKGHLSFVYDHFDPTSIVISIGDYAGKEMQFGVKGNKPNPATVDTTTGLVKYELVEQDWESLSGDFWDRNTLIKGLKAKNHEEYVVGTVLVQMLENRKIKFEAFPGKKASHIYVFTTNAKIFER
ncbi:MAG: hypothetical protein UT34_C0001G0498 [candidate division WS6 bacterium GW2011_GWF2_39_15]|uniref:Peptidase M23 domain-containing protein n=1 Tax=candidate division WS6 bacterium GW2011_GWF2_39_15 TaxID=1619100 RepID=A0A0G0QXT2_9BACT|nr:MAG: hypothetical protein UT34_C0001G0498 [candidate division WS6 bacterium GW2011_GWF2_39_15]